MTCHYTVVLVNKNVKSKVNVLEIQCVLFRYMTCHYTVVIVPENVGFWVNVFGPWFLRACLINSTQVY